MRPSFKLYFVLFCFIFNFCVSFRNRLSNISYKRARLHKSLPPETPAIAGFILGGGGCSLVDLLLNNLSQALTYTHNHSVLNAIYFSRVITEPTKNYRLTVQ